MSTLQDVPGPLVSPFLRHTSTQLLGNSWQLQPEEVSRTPQAGDKSQEGSLGPEHGLLVFKVAKEMKSQNLLVGTSFCLVLKLYLWYICRNAYTVIPGNTAAKAEHFYAGEKTSPESSLDS